jgi:hypothetical protein
MFRALLYMLLAVVLISVLRSVIGVLMKAFGSIIGAADASSSASSGPKSAQLGGDLHRDPVCGTFVAETTPHQHRISGQIFYFCSDACKEKHALAAR